MKGQENHRTDAVTDAALSKRLALISECSKRLHYSDTFVENVAVVLQEISDVLEADACVVRTLEEDRLHLLGAHGAPVDALHPVLKTDEGLADVMINGRRATSIVSADQDPVTAEIDRRVRDSGDKHLFRFHSFAGAPMFADGDVVGVLGVYVIQTERTFGARDLELLQILANAVGMALANNRML